MATIQQSDTQSQPTSAINFQVPDDLKLRIDLEVTTRRTTLREFCTTVITEYLDREEKRRKR
jgi:hypothetical protein